MSRTFAIVLRYASDIESAELAELRQRFAGVRVFALKIDAKRAEIEALSFQEFPVNVDAEMYFSDLTHSYFASRKFEKILFWGCPELAVTILRVQLCHLGFAKTSIAVCPSRTTPVEKSHRFLAVEGLTMCSGMKSTDVAGVVEFFSHETVGVNDDALFAASPITVAIPTKDRWELLKKTLETFERQTFRDFRILVGDDASEPGGRAEFDSWLTKYKGPAVEIFTSEKTLGPGATRNLLAKRATTPYLVFFDDDNLAAPEMMETWSKLTRLPMVDAFSCAYESFIERPGGKIERGADFAFIGKVVGRSIEMNGFGDSASLFKRSSFLAAGGFDEDPTALFEDFELFLRMHMMGYELRTIPHRLFRYRRHPSQRSHTAAFERGLARLASTSKKWNLKCGVTKSNQPRLSDFAVGWRDVDHLGPRPQ
ncbi:MAG: glycosyltransferase [Bdellovibrionota bacterium]